MSNYDPIVGLLAQLLQSQQEFTQTPIVRKRTKLSKKDEDKFIRWYWSHASKAGIDLNPDNPAHKYDYRGAFKEGVNPEIGEDGLYHWPSKFKDPDHPNRFVNGIDTTKE